MLSLPHNYYLCLSSFPPLSLSLLHLHTHIHTLTPQITLISNLQVFDALIVHSYWFHSAAALSGHLKWWGKTIAAKSSLAFIRRLSGGNQLVRVYWNLINNWCRLMGRTTGKFVLRFPPVGQCGWWKLLNNYNQHTGLFSINNLHFFSFFQSFSQVIRVDPSHPGAHVHPLSVNI